MRTARVIRWGLLAIVLVIVIAVVVLVLNLDRIVKQEVQTQASSSLNLQTTLGGASVGLLGGNVKLSDLQIGSPQGFAAPHMLELGGAKVGVSYGQLRDDPMHIGAITLTRPKLVIEQVDGKLNFKSAMEQLPKTPEQTPGPAQGASKPLRLIIDTLSVQDPQVVLRPGIPGLSQEITIPVPSLELKNVGAGDGNQNGAAIKDVVMQVIGALADGASHSDQLPAQLKALLHLNVGEMAGMLGQTFSKQIAGLDQSLPGAGTLINGALKDPNSLMKDPGKSLQQGLGGVLGKGAGPSATQPGQTPQDAVEQGLGGLLGKHSK